METKEIEKKIADLEHAIMNHSHPQVEVVHIEPKPEDKKKE